LGQKGGGRVVGEFGISLDKAGIVPDPFFHPPFKECVCGSPAIDQRHTNAESLPERIERERERDALLKEFQVVNRGFVLSVDACERVWRLPAKDALTPTNLLPAREDKSRGQQKEEEISVCSEQVEVIASAEGRTKCDEEEGGRDEEARSTEIFDRSVFDGKMDDRRFIQHPKGKPAQKDEPGRCVCESHMLVTRTANQGFNREFSIHRIVNGVDLR